MKWQRRFAAVHVRSPSCGCSEEIPISSEFLRRRPSPGVALRRRAVTARPRKAKSIPLTLPRSQEAPEQKKSRLHQRFSVRAGKSTDGEIFLRREMSRVTASGGLRDQSLKNPTTLRRGDLRARQSEALTTNEARPAPIYGRTDVLYVLCSVYGDRRNAAAPTYADPADRSLSGGAVIAAERMGPGSTRRTGVLYVLCSVYGDRRKASLSTNADRPGRSLPGPSVIAAEQADVGTAD